MSDETYPSDWVKVTLMVSPDGEMNVVGGDRENGDGDQPYMGFERIKAQRREERDQLKAECERLRTCLENIRDKYGHYVINNGTSNLSLFVKAAIDPQAATPNEDER